MRTRRVAQHKTWVRTGQGEAPLLSRDQLLECINQFMVEFRQRPSDGNDMDGFAPEAVFHKSAPAGGFRRISDEELAWNTAEHFDVKIAKGGIIRLRDGKRYSDPQLLLIQGENRELCPASPRSPANFRVALRQRRRGHYRQAPGARGSE